MLSLKLRSCGSAGRNGFPPTKLRHFAFSKPTRLLFVSILCLILIVILGFAPSSQKSPPSTPLNPKKARFSLLVPATSTNQDLCKLILSGQILNYPTPILINYGATEFEDPYVQHLAKVEGILKYLDSLGSSKEYAEDLVLIVDGYDVWFQLPASILLRRYYELNAAANARIANIFGQKIAAAHDMRQAIVFGPDKICWPTDYSRPACWAVSNSNLNINAFGPETSKSFQSRSQPRWLNSGTIIGPVQDLKELFSATLAEIHANHTTDSDQFYLAEVFGRQEYARLQHKPELLEQYKSIRYGEELDNPDAEVVRSDTHTAGLKTEYHIGIDYESAMFQTIAYWKQFLAWMRAADSFPAAQGEQTLTANAYTLRLPTDVEQSRAPFASIESDPNSDFNLSPSWRDVELLFNTVSRKIPVMIHFTGEKRFRHIWWKNIWFQKYAKQLREASVRQLHEHNKPYGPIGGYIWYNAESTDAEEVHMHGVGGAWSDRGGWFSWKTLCAQFEDDLYAIPGDGLFHATLQDKADSEAGAQAEADAAPGDAAFNARFQVKPDAGAG